MTTQVGTKNGKLSVDGGTLGYVELGEGSPLIVFSAGEGAAAIDTLATTLAQSRRLIFLDLGSSSAASRTEGWAKQLSQAILGLGFARYSVMGVAKNAADALVQAVVAPDTVDKVVLQSPAELFRDTMQEGWLPRVAAPTLVLVGTRDTSDSAAIGRLCRENIPTSFLSFVYGAGHSVGTDRPQACANVITDFLEQGEQFIICRQAQMIAP
jgi:pimeloyl-ACP methyl ester carboxylesterase